MTPVEYAIVTAIKGLTRKTGYPPSYREVAKAAGLQGLGQLTECLRRMRTEGLVYFEDNRNRSLSVLCEYEGHRPDILARIDDDALDYLCRNVAAELARRALAKAA